MTSTGRRCLVWCHCWCSSTEQWSSPSVGAYYPTIQCRINRYKVFIFTIIIFNHKAFLSSLIRRKAQQFRKLLCDVSIHICWLFQLNSINYTKSWLRYNSWTLLRETFWSTKVWKLAGQSCHSLLSLWIPINDLFYNNVTK